MKLFGYQEFIGYEIYEAVVNLGKEFKDILRSMRSEVAWDMLQLVDKDLKIATNYLNITDRDDTISFYPANAKGTKYEIVNSGNTYVSYTALFKKRGLPNEIYPELPIGTKGDITYTFTNQEIPAILPNRKIHHFISDGGEHCMIGDEGVKMVPSGKTQEGSIGRLCRRMLQAGGYEHTDKEIEDFVNEYKSKIAIRKNKSLLLDLVDGDNIKYYYHDDRYDYAKKSTLHSSCMRYNECQEYLEIYCQNPEVCKLLIMRSERDEMKITARALIWTLKDGTIFMDRIYYSEDSQVQIFHEYARSKGWCYKSAQNSASNATISFSDSKSYDGDLVVQLTKWEFSSYPYVDTIKFLSKLQHTLCNKSYGDTKTLDDAEGGNAECEMCSGTEEVSCGECNGDGEVECPNCDGSGEDECSTCNGSGEEECSRCGGDGTIGSSDGEEIECPTCKGNGEMECTECSGDGHQDCSRCDGDGEIECSACDGTGEVECPECS